MPIIREPCDEVRDQYRLRLERANRLAESLEAELRTLRAENESLRVALEVAQHEADKGE